MDRATSTWAVVVADVDDVAAADNDDGVYFWTGDVVNVLCSSHSPNAEMTVPAAAAAALACIDVDRLRMLKLWF